MRPLEIGAGGVMVSMVRSPEEAEQAVRWAKFWPRGERGMNGGNRDGRFGLTPMAEYAGEGQRLDVRRHPDRDGHGAGRGRRDRRGPRRRPRCSSARPTSARCSGVPGQFEHPKCFEAIERIADACRAAGKPWGIVPKGPDYAERMAKLGCRMFVVGFDVHALHEGLRGIKGRYGAFFHGEEGG